MCGHILPRESAHYHEGIVSKQIHRSTSACVLQRGRGKLELSYKETVSKLTCLQITGICPIRRFGPLGFSWRQRKSLSLSKGSFSIFSPIFYIFYWSQVMETKHLLFIECLLGVRDCVKHFTRTAFSSVHNPVCFTFSVFYRLGEPRSSELLITVLGFQHCRQQRRSSAHVCWTLKPRV